jgi:homoserine dehydrogenase
MKEIGIGILGFGTVGAGVVEGIQQNGDVITERTGLKLVLRRIADLDLDRDRGVSVSRSLLTRDAQSVVHDPAVQVVVELIGGTGIARTLTLEALAHGKAVVTANKALLAEHGDEIYGAAERHNADLLFEASVGGGIPIIRALREGLSGNRIQRISGILNGTCNYILTRMEREKLPFDRVLQEAQAAGYAEAEPSLDIDGLDTAHKAVVLAAQAFGAPIHMSDLQVRGIRNLDAMDIEFAAGLGYRIKLLAVIKNEDGEIELGVHPALVPHDHMLASVHHAFNAVLVRGDVVGETLYYGQGAGRAPTASAVIADVVDAARNLEAKRPRRVPAFSLRSTKPRLRAAADVWTRYYLRLSLKDQPGMFARVAHILGGHGISIASLMQKEVQSGEFVPVIILTHEAREGAFMAALDEIDALDQVGAPTVRYRIEDFA